MNTHSRSDTLPWFKQFWPWFLISLPAAVVVAGLVTLYIANLHSDDLVSQDYYKNGLEINRRLESTNLARQQGLTAQLSFTQHSVTARLNQPLEDEQISLVLSHPLEADRDFSVTLEKLQPGEYGGLLREPIEIRWHWTLQNLQAPLWRIDGATSPAHRTDSTQIESVP